MNLRNLLILSLLVVLLGGYLYLYEYKKEKTPSGDEKARMLTDLKGDQVGFLKVQRPEGGLCLAWTVGGWRMEEPLKDQADSSQVEALAKELAECVAIQVVEENSRNPAQYGLKQPRITVTMHKRGESGHRVTILLGDDEPINNGVYCMVEGRTSILLVANSLVARLTQEADSYRDKRLLGVEEERIARVVLEKPDSRLILIRQEGKDNWELKAETNVGGKWQAQGEPLRADPAKVGALMSTLGFEKALSFQNGPPPQSGFGWNRPALTLSVWEKGRNNPQTLQIGARSAAPAPPPEMPPGMPPPAGPEPQYFARAIGRDAVFLVGEHLLRDLPLDLEQLRDHRLMPVAEKNVVRISLAWPEQNLVLVRQNDKGWKVEGDPKARIDPARVDSLLQTVVNLRYLEKGVKTSDSGFARPKLTISVGLKEGKSPPKVVVGRNLEQKGEVYLRVGDEPDVYTSANYFLSSLPKSAADLAPQK